MIIYDQLKQHFFSFFIIIYLLIFRKLGMNLKNLGKNTSIKNKEIIKNIKEILII